VLSRQGKVTNHDEINLNIIKELKSNIQSVKIYVTKYALNTTEYNPSNLSISEHFNHMHFKTMKMHVYISYLNR